MTYSRMNTLAGMIFTDMFFPFRHYTIEDFLYRSDYFSYSSEDIATAMQMLEKSGLIKVHKGSDGKKYFWRLPKFLI